MQTLSPNPLPISPFVGLNTHITGAGVLLLCDHASAIIPPDYQDLGLDPAQRFTHVVWDIGAAKVTRSLARHLNCPALLSGVSRLVVDCNRFPHDPAAMPANSCGVEVPGNRRLTPAQRQDRLDRWFHPYHSAIETTIAAMDCPLIVSIHSFTPRIDGQAWRPWQIGLLWNQDRRVIDPVAKSLSAMPAIEVGLNQPYSGQDINYTLDRHAGAAGLPHISFEIRQDCLATEQDCAMWGQRLAQILAPCAVSAAIRTPLPPQDRLSFDDLPGRV